MLNELELAIHRCRRAGNAGASQCRSSLGNSTQTAPQPYCVCFCLLSVAQTSVYAQSILVPSPYTCRPYDTPHASSTLLMWGVVPIRPLFVLPNGFAAVTCRLHKYQATPVCCYCSTVLCVMARALSYFNPGPLCHMCGVWSWTENASHIGGLPPPPSAGSTTAHASKAAATRTKECSRPPAPCGNSNTNAFVALSFCNRHRPPDLPLSVTYVARNTIVAFLLIREATTPRSVQDGLSSNHQASSLVQPSTPLAIVCRRSPSLSTRLHHFPVLSPTFRSELYYYYIALSPYFQWRLEESRKS
jgi:hypothetical protein